ncbi:polygalacturonase [Selaginella moellendorffii]|nr:polygalacturonase [Selaginella moellendorffii]|eukprot:XP_002974127.2 polygalacturonase [Selaginella moellendorffii]
MFRGILLLFMVWTCAALASGSKTSSSSKPSCLIGGTTFNLQDYGAKGDGVTDDTQALERAWQDACKSPDATLLIPGGKTFLIAQVSLQGPCKPNTKIRIEGNIHAPDASSWSNSNSAPWIQIKNLEGLKVEATGTLDGNGASWWSRACKPTAGSTSCRKAPTSIEFNTVKNLRVNGLEVVNSPRMHVNFNGCQHVAAQWLRINSPGNSPNTDGIHITNSQDVVIKYVMVAAGDDCVSIVGGSSNIDVSSIVCGPGHGISIGSLGGGDVVSGVRVRNANLIGTTNGVRIKSYKNGHGTVSDVSFEDVRMDEVANPIIIDQAYCDAHEHDCGAEAAAEEVSGVSISGVRYKNISGTSKTKTAITLRCSQVVGCDGIELDNVEITQAINGANADARCSNAYGVAGKNVFPESCLAAQELKSRRASSSVQAEKVSSPFS